MSLENVIRLHDLSNEFDDRQVAVDPVACAVSFPQSENRIPPVQSTASNTNAMAMLSHVAYVYAKSDATLQA